MSRQIKGLESKLGVQLFNRTPKGVEPTAAGQTLMDEVPNILMLVKRAEDRTRLAGQGKLGRLDVGLFGSGVLDVIPRILAQFHALRPDITIGLHNLTKSEQLQALRERRIAIGFNRLLPNEPDLVVETVLREPLYLAMPESHDLAAHQTIALPQLDNMPMILYPNLPIPGLAQEIHNEFRRLNLRLRVEQDVEDVVTAVALVASGFGVAITTQSATRLSLPGVIFRPLAVGHDLSDIELQCLYRRGDPSPILAAFLEVVHNFCQQNTPALAEMRKILARIP